MNTDITLDMLLNGNSHTERLQGLAKMVTDAQAEVVLGMIAGSLSAYPPTDWIETVVKAFSAYSQVVVITVYPAAYEGPFEYVANIYVDELGLNTSLRDWLSNWFADHLPALPSTHNYVRCRYELVPYTEDAQREIFDCAREWGEVVYSREIAGKYVVS